MNQTWNVGSKVYAGEFVNDLITILKTKLIWEVYIYAVKDQFMEPIHTCGSHSKEGFQTTLREGKTITVRHVQKIIYSDGVQGD